MLVIAAWKSSNSLKEFVAPITASRDIELNLCKCVPAWTVMVLVLAVVPETPRYLLVKGRWHRAAHGREGSIVNRCAQVQPVCKHAMQCISRGRVSLSKPPQCQHTSVKVTERALHNETHSNWTCHLNTAAANT